MTCSTVGHWSCWHWAMAMMTMILGGWAISSHGGSASGHIGTILWGEIEWISSPGRKNIEKKARMSSKSAGGKARGQSPPACKLASRNDGVSDAFSAFEGEAGRIRGSQDLVMSMSPWSPAM